MKDGRFLTLGIESSCDETAAAVVADGRDVLSSIISSQIEIHKAYGGVVPEIASRHHVTNINGVIEEALDKAGVSLEEIDLIGVTNGPGLVGALVIGIATAKALALAKNKPMVGVNHMYGHVSSNFLTYKNLKPPFVTLIVSGGHTDLALMEDYTSCKILGSTRDDAVGEAYDKVARVIGLGYPGGPKVDKLAEQGCDSLAFKRVTLEKDSYDFSFSGLKTAVLNYANSQRQKSLKINEADVARSFQEAVIDVLTDKALKAVEDLKLDKLVVAGGVGANRGLRRRLAAECEKKSIKLYLPDLAYCTDNAAMIASAAYFKYKAKGPDNLTLDALPNMAY